MLNGVLLFVCYVSYGVWFMYCMHILATSVLGVGVCNTVRASLFDETNSEGMYNTIGYIVKGPK